MARGTPLPLENPMNHDEEMPGAVPLATGWLTRTLRFASAITEARVRKATGAGSAESTAVAAQRLFEAFGSLRGVAMKMGQMLSYMDAALPAEAQKVLSQLQAHVPPMAEGVAERIIEQDFGAPPRHLFSDWSARPIAAASIGQVHRARLHDGTLVAVKVQYPEIARAIESDLKNLTVVEALARLLAPTVDARAIVREIRERMREECDYRREAENQKAFRHAFQHDRGLEVPAVIDELVSQRVLSTRFVEGLEFAGFAATATTHDRNRAGESLVRAAFGAIFQHSMLNCDPHPGNYLFAGGRTVLLDFGCVKRFTPALVETWRAMILAGIQGNRSQFDECVDAMGIPRGKKFDYGYHYELSRCLYEPFLRDQTFTYTQEYVTRCNAVLLRDNPNKRCSDFPADLVFANRLQWGLNSVLVMLRAEANWHRVLMPILEPCALDGERAGTLAPALPQLA
jgi:predicted unusual protein kinase regulating ubiquinone biosynthesis (AarF/ABC1/UbiB family)